MFLKTLGGDLINSRYISRIYIEQDTEGDVYSATDVIAEISGSKYDEILASFDSGDPDFDLEDAENFIRSLEKKLNQQTVFVSNQILPVANCGG